MPRSPLFLVPLFLLTLSPALCARDPMQWERLHTRAVPTRLLARLGVTHITRFGYTRDGNQKSEPDPTFPPGLTDVVPLDATHTLLVCGTAAGRVVFRARMTQQDARMLLPRVHVAADLSPAPSPSPVVPLPPATDGDVSPTAPVPDVQPDISPSVTSDAPDAPIVLTVPDAGGVRLYLLDVDDAPGGGYLARVQVNLVSSLPVGGAGESPATAAPSTPPVWSTPQTFRVPANMSASWRDTAAFRDGERRRLHLPSSAVPELDRVLHLVITQIEAGPALPAPPAAVVH